MFLSSGSYKINIWMVFYWVTYIAVLPYWQYCWNSYYPNFTCIYVKNNMNYNWGSVQIINKRFNDITAILQLVLSLNVRITPEKPLKKKSTFISIEESLLFCFSSQWGGHTWGSKRSNTEGRGDLSGVLRRGLSVGLKVCAASNGWSVSTSHWPSLKWTEQML